MSCQRHSRLRRSRWMLPVAGLLSLFWFLIRVVPKPSRASYPCQRAAAPLAAGFVVWLAGAFGSVALFRRGKRLWPGSRTWAAASLAAAAVLAIVVLATMPQPKAVAEPNQPVGVGKGIHPGRVVWTRDAQATRWAGPGQGHPWENDQTSRPAVDAMMSNTVRRLTGERSDRAAWQALFRHFNSTHGGGNAPYRAGEKITIKVNFVGCIFTEGNVDTKTYDLTAPRRIDYMNTSPQLIGALLRQLVDNAGVRQEDIAVGDPTALFPNQYYDLLHAEFPKVRYMDHNGGIDGHPRERAALSQTPLYWSARPEGREQDFVPVQYAEAKYLINMANLKAHTMAGVTLTAKNHFGSLIRTPPQRGYFDMHASTAGRNPGMGKYRDLVDLIGHAHLGGKTLIYFIDGLYPGVHPIENFPRKFSTPPFNGAWGASLFASEDPVAIDSVGLDFLAAEWDNYPRMNGVDDYLHEAALAANPPSGTFYDPNHPVPTTRLASLGVHEHWNNAQERKYSRNLGKSEGIELVQ